jgi:predicted component of type VI protein secretion system
MSKLIIRYPNNVIKEAEFDKPKYKIGTAPDNDLVLEHEAVQAHQAEIDSSEGAFSVVDVSENKSTTVNGKKIERVNLNYGDRIEFGPVVGLFYPSKKEAVGDRTKLFLFMAAGGFVLILSVVLMFYLASRRISSAVTEQIGGGVPPREEVRPRPQRVKTRRERPRREPVEVEEGEGAAVETEVAEGETEAAESGGRMRPREYRELILPEPTPEQIRVRAAVAVPRGIKGLFFKKIPVIAAEAVPTQGEISAGEAEAAGGTLAQGEGLEARPLSTAPGEEVEPAETAAQPAEVGEQAPEAGEESAPEKKGVFVRARSSVNRLFGGGRTEEAPVTEEETFEEAATAEEGTEEGEGAEAEAAPSGEAVEGLESDITKLVEPLTALRKLDIPELKTRGFKEKPVYNESELMGFKEKNVLGETRLSELEDVNATTLWEYLAGAGAGGETAAAADAERAARGGTITRTGAVGRLSGARGGEVVYGTNKGTVIGLSGDGREIFSRDVGKEHGRAFYEPLLGDLNKDGRDEIVLVFENGTIASFGSDMDRLWVYEGKGKITSLPAFVDVSGDDVKDIVFPTIGMDLVAVDGKTGFELWKFFDATGETLSSPVGLRINEDSRTDIVFVTVDGFLHGVDGKTGWGLWKGNISGRPAGGPALGPIGEGKEDSVVTLTRNGTLSGHDRSGKPLFTYDMKSSFVTGPSLGDTDGDGKNEIVTVDVQGIVRAVEGPTRREKWRVQSEGGTTIGRVALADMNDDGGMDVVFTTLSGALTVLDGKNGNLIARRNTGDFSFATPLVADLNGDKKLEMIIAGRGGGIGAVQVASSGAKFISFKKSSWPSVNRDGMNTGYSKFSFRDRGN